MSNPKAVPACIHFRKEGHNFIQHAKFTLTEQLTETVNVNKDKATLKLRLKQRVFLDIKTNTLTHKAYKPKNQKT